MALYIAPAKIQLIDDAIAAKVADREAVDELMTFICGTIGYDEEYFKDYTARHRTASLTYRKKQKEQQGTTYNAASKKYYLANKAKINAKAVEKQRVRRAAEKQLAQGIKDTL